MPRTPAEWHNRFLQQAAWTTQVRRYLLARVRTDEGSRVLEVGCGTGAITALLQNETAGRIYGLDLNLTFLRLARRADSSTRFTVGDALRLPYPGGVFDAVVCHFLLLWVADAGTALAEMVRAVRPGGLVAAFAEPDYGGRIDYPPELEELGRLQAAALRRQGATPNQGRALAGLFHAAGLEGIETGVLGGKWQGAPRQAELEQEWQTLESDLEDLLPAERLRAFRALDRQAWQNGQRVLYVPTFYAAGTRPG